MEAFVKSDLGQITYNAHAELGVTVCESQSAWTPLQRDFLALAADHYGPDESEIPDPPSKTRSPRNF